VLGRVRARGGKHGGIADERGVAMIEFALVLPILVLVAAGLLAFGQIFFYWLDANRLASETARFAVVDQNPFAPTPLQEHIRASVPSGMQDLQVCIDFPAPAPPPPAPRIGDPIRVRVQKSFSFIPLLGIGEIKVRASSTMRIERFADGTGLTAVDPGQDIGTCS
jgi:Flp pilus assembly pilin Flp